MNQPNLHIQILREGAVLPEYKTSGSAGMDLSACLTENLILPNGKVVFVPTGLAMSIPEGYEGQIRPRSGFSTKNSIIMPNTPGTIDSDYRGEILIPLLNISGADFVLEPGTRVAQIVFQAVAILPVQVVKELIPTERGTGGFGSTGK
ncbi:dUTP diphosphatase [Leptospira sp. 2 VSF19]|uniref:Deoxyuridine 5'-triphosphate nucleotidohydrolase n=1 Tax=Leptospira soteropolitanensis TaxID=2950025 RepID=A0AAW5VFG3_9LEPT|nr:dUTP diphosphatase [Leptospira soteropolitanensis]MCW7492355.1 dUTP diphosphatase [Leptospira soteropolitanensis]MCW7499937.1 dUTP diphosphatase [Leptospira soteropolitanensis]MCW7522188.1 dUTP diphosphatase [Leptospira soteropolitanensis]MCW7526042.1 dUTP diphosphatase [Leptospira soteropolitanensis]MCW7529844.1 dUTP diphosphatase [Leptospira soteropolitanensis]